MQKLQDNHEEQLTMVQRASSELAAGQQKLEEETFEGN